MQRWAMMLPAGALALLIAALSYWLTGGGLSGDGTPVAPGAEQVAARPLVPVPLPAAGGSRPAVGRAGPVPTRPTGLPLAAPQAAGPALGGEEDGAPGPRFPGDTTLPPEPGDGEGLPE